MFFRLSKRPHYDFDPLLHSICSTKQKKVILHHEEKASIRSLGEVDAWDREALNVSPPLVGPDRAQRYGQITKRKRLGKKGDCTLVPVGPKTLVVDLCETMVHISRTPRICDYEV